MAYSWLLLDFIVMFQRQTMMEENFPRGGKRPARDEGQEPEEKRLKVDDDLFAEVCFGCLHMQSE